MSDIRFTLSLQIIERPEPNRHRTFLDASVLIWDGTEHISTVSVGTMTDIKLPEEAEIDTVEQWAAVVTRAAARNIDQNFFDALAQEAIHTRDHFIEKLASESAG